MTTAKTSRAALALLAGAACALALVSNGCDAGSSDGPTASNGDVSGVEMALEITPGTTVNTIGWEITGPGSFSKVGSIDVSHSGTISTTIAPIPPGMGFTIALVGTAVGNTARCTGSQDFSIAAHQTTSVLVHLLCQTAPRNGSASVSGALNVCPLIDSLGASPAEVFVGGTMAVAAQAHDADSGPSALAYQWSVSSGTLSSATAQNPTFTCTTAGPVTLTLVVSDGSSSTGCPDTQSLSIVCTPPGSAGASGSAPQP